MLLHGVFEGVPASFLAPEAAFGSFFVWQFKHPKPVIALDGDAGAALATPASTLGFEGAAASGCPPPAAANAVTRT
jgi:hypothetical protein